MQLLGHGERFFRLFFGLTVELKYSQLQLFLLLRSAEEFTALVSFAQNRNLVPSYCFFAVYTLSSYFLGSFKLILE